MSKAKQKGTAWETKLCNTINDWAGDKVSERVALKGNEDQGDIRLLVDDLTFTVEAKYRKAYPSDGMLAEFKRQTALENDNAKQDGGLLVCNIPNRSVLRADVWMQTKTLYRLHGADRVLEQVELPDGTREFAMRMLGDEGEHGWLRLTLLDFLWTCYGAPAWEYGG